jgi:hypothetical protein
MTFHDGDSSEVSLWNDEEGFYFDAVRPSSSSLPFVCSPSSAR